MNPSASDFPSVLLVEDNQRLREELVHYLTAEGFTARGVGSGEDLNRALEEQLAEILVLDLNLADEDGLSIARRIRRAMPGMGIIILTGRVGGDERLEGYLSGADIYLTKPTRPEELAAVIRNLFARLAPPKFVDQWQLDIARMVLITPAGGQIALTGSEVRLLKLLALQGQVIEHGSLAELLGDPGQPEAVNKARVEVVVSRLRRKLRQHAGARDCIKVQRHAGYQLGIAVTLLNLDTGPPGRGPVLD